MTEEEKAENTETPTEDKPPELILGKYKTQDDLVRAYQDAESKLGTLQQEKTQLQQQLSQRAATPATVEEPEDFWTDPEKVIKRHVEAAISPLLAGTLDAQRSAIRTANPEYAKYDAEVDAVLASMPELKKTPQFLPQIYRMVRGLHEDDIEKDLRAKWEKEQGKKSETYAEGSDSSSEGKRGGKDFGLSEDEKRVALKFNPGLSPAKAYEEYAKWK